MCIAATGSAHCLMNEIFPHFPPSTECQWLRLASSTATSTPNVHIRPQSLLPSPFIDRPTIRPAAASSNGPLQVNCVLTKTPVKKAEPDQEKWTRPPSSSHQPPTIKARSRPSSVEFSLVLHSILSSRRLFPRRMCGVRRVGLAPIPRPGI